MKRRAEARARKREKVADFEDRHKNCRRTAVSICETSPMTYRVYPVSCSKKENNSRDLRMQTSIVRSNVRRYLAACHSKLQSLVVVIGKTHASQPFFHEPTTRGSGAMEQHQLKASRTRSTRLHTVLRARDAMEQHHHHRRSLYMQP
jgi:hypothetical protein